MFLCVVLSVFLSFFRFYFCEDLLSVQFYITWSSMGVIAYCNQEMFPPTCSSFTTSLFISLNASQFCIVEQSPQNLSAYPFCKIHELCDAPT